MVSQVIIFGDSCVRGLTEIDGPMHEVRATLHEVSLWGNRTKGGEFGRIDMLRGHMHEIRAKIKTLMQTIMLLLFILDILD